VKGFSQASLLQIKNKTVIIQFFTLVFFAFSRQVFALVGAKHCLNWGEKLPVKGKIRKDLAMESSQLFFLTDSRVYKKKEINANDSISHLSPSLI